jgi:hypothetical protein
MPAADRRRGYMSAATTPPVGGGREALSMGKSLTYLFARQSTCPV